MIDFLEFGFGLGIVLVLVRVVFHGKFAVGALDFIRLRRL